MALMSPDERAFAQAVSKLAYCNPFTPERIACEREALGDEFAERGAVWSLTDGDDTEHPNLLRILERVETLAADLRKRLEDKANPGQRDGDLYTDLVVYLMYYRVQQRMHANVIAPDARGENYDFYGDFARDVSHFFSAGGVDPGRFGDAPHLFACVFQVRRAFHAIYTGIVGASMPVARLRSAVWESTFTHHMRRYQRALYDRMGDITTLVTGPSGTGKELVARAIARSRFIPFDEKKLRFAEDFRVAFRPLNLSALSPTLIESELFGHRRGAFTGALEDRIGHLEACSPLGTVFLDEIGDVDTAIQVKLLRVLQTRRFQRLGDVEARRFEGKLVAATNRDLGAEMRAGRFREDLYYRLCSDIIETPSLGEQLADSPDDLHNLILFAARQAAGDEAGEVAGEVEAWIEQNLGRRYPWPGNFRELEQCVRNVLIHRGYTPLRPAEPAGRERVARAFRQGELSAEEMLRAYCTLVYALTDNYSEAARRLGLDRRTVKDRIDPELLSELSR